MDGIVPDEPENRSPEERTRGRGPAPGPPGENGAPRAVPAMSWGLVVWGFLIAVAALAASETTGLWWLVLVFGLLVPAVSALQSSRSTRRGVRPAVEPQDEEAELLGVLDELGELTATTAAMRTSLTVEEAAGMLDKLAREGHLQATTQGAVVLYGLWEPDRRGTNRVRAAPTEPAEDHTGEPPGVEEDGASAPALPDGEEATSPVPPLVEPLTEREREVFGLLATGRTNREIAADLFVTVGSIKAHTSNIYAKLQVRNRAAALARGRELGLLD